MNIDDTALQLHQAEVLKAKAWADQFKAWKLSPTNTKTLAVANLQIERMGAVVLALLKEKFDVTE